MSALNVVKPEPGSRILSGPSGEPLELLWAAQDVLVQGLELLFDLGDQTFSRVVASPYPASIGQHYAYSLDHFHCLLRGQRAGEVSYENHERNPRLEREVSYASIAICDILRAIKNYNEDTLARECKVVRMVENGRPPLSPINSSIGDELAHCTSHAIHHYAIIRLICGELGVRVPAQFGSAPPALKRSLTQVTY